MKKKSGLDRKNVIFLVYLNVMNTKSADKAVRLHERRSCRSTRYLRLQVTKKCEVISVNKDSLDYKVTKKKIISLHCRFPNNVSKSRTI